jgi:hypothetical protein
VPLAPPDQLAGVVAALAPLSVVLADWLSTTAALGSGWRPSATRTRRRSASLIRAQVPSSRQRLKYQYAVRQLGKPSGRYRHWQPVRNT